MLDFYVYVPFLITWPLFRCWENRGNCIFFFLVLLQFCHIALQNPRSYPDFQLVLLYFWFHRAQCLIFVFTCHFSSLLGLCFVYEKKEETAFLFFLVVVVVVVLFLLLLQFCRIALQNPSSYSNFQLVLLYFWFHRVQCLIFVFTCRFSLLGFCFVAEKTEENRGNCIFFCSSSVLSTNKELSLRKRHIVVLGWVVTNDNESEI